MTFGANNTFPNITAFELRPNGGASTNSDGAGTIVWNGELSPTEIIINCSLAYNSQGASVAGSGVVTRLTFRGTGTNPFGTDNCT